MTVNMKEKTIINFIYSEVYDQVLSELADGFGESQAEEVSSQTALLSEKWAQYEEKVISELKKYPPYAFNPQQVNCYLVRKFPYTGISDPLTIRLREGANLDLAIATLVHELVHISIEPKEAALSAKIGQEFPEVTEYRTQLHVVVNFIEYNILKQVFDKPTLDKIMERELILKGLKDAWNIVLSDEDKLSKILIYI